jgi:hypothetical protein
MFKNSQHRSQGRELDENDLLDNIDAADMVLLPARLEYYDSEKKWRDGAAPKKRIILRECFDINRKKETANQFVITVYTFSEGLDILFENDQVPILPKVSNIGLQIFVPCTFYIFVSLN